MIKIHNATMFAAIPVQPLIGHTVVDKFLAVLTDAERDSFAVCVSVAMMTPATGAILEKAFKLFRYNDDSRAFARILDRVNKPNKVYALADDEGEGYLCVPVQMYADGTLEPADEACELLTAAAREMCAVSREDVEKLVVNILYVPDEDGPDKYATARQVEAEDFLNELKTLGYDVSDVDADELGEMCMEFVDALYTDDAFNAVYSEVAQSIAKKHGLEA